MDSPSLPVLAAAPLAAGAVPATIDLAIAAWLQAKAGRSGSERTRQAYSATLSSFRAALAAAGVQLDGPAAAVALVAQGWAGLNDPSPATFNQRLAIVSSFYTFARKQGLLSGENPIERVERRRVQRYASAKALPLDGVRQALARLAADTSLAGRRDYCILAVGLQTGRRVAELAGLRWGDVEVGAQITLTWRRTKGGKAMRDTLPASLSKALASYLRAAYPGGLRGLPPSAPVWVSTSSRNPGAAVSTTTIRRLCEEHLGTSKVHALRHTFARTMETTGAKLSEIQSRLGHSNPATTGIYMAALTSNENPHADALAELLGL